MKSIYLTSKPWLLFAGLFVFSSVQPAKKQHHVITSDVGEHGIISPHGNTSVIRGGEIRFTITPDSGWHSDSVVVDGVNQGALSMYVFTNVSEDHRIRASFRKSENAPMDGMISSDASKDKKQLLISVFAGAHGSISSNGELFVSPHGSVELSIAADSGYAVDSVLVDGGYVGSVTSYSFTNVMYDHVLVATFTKKKE